MAIKITAHIPEGIVRRLGVAEGESLAARITDAVDRYAVVMAAARNEVLDLLTEAELLQVKVACQAWLTRQAPAESLVGGVEAELRDAADEDGVLEGEDVSSLLDKLRSMSPVQELALVELLERGPAPGIR